MYLAVKDRSEYQNICGIVGDGDLYLSGQDVAFSRGFILLIPNIAEIKNLNKFFDSVESLKTVVMVVGFYDNLIPCREFAMVGAGHTFKI